MMRRGVSSMILRETAISIFINVVISAGFFIALFGLEPTGVAARGYAVDFLPQAFMVALMGSLMPGLITAARARSHRRLAFLLVRGWLAIFVRSLTIAVGLMFVAGGLAAAAVILSGAVVVDGASAIAIKMVFGGLVAILVTPSAVRFAMAEDETTIRGNGYGQTH